GGGKREASIVGQCQRVAFQIQRDAVGRLKGDVSRLAQPFQVSRREGRIAVRRHRLRRFRRSSPRRRQGDAPPRGLVLVRKSLGIGGKGGVVGQDFFNHPAVISS